MILDIEQFDEKSLILTPFFIFSDMKNCKITYLMTWVVSLQFIGRMFDVKAKAASEAKRLVFDVILFVLVSS